MLYTVKFYSRILHLRQQPGTLVDGQHTYTIYSVSTCNHPNWASFRSTVWQIYKIWLSKLAMPSPTFGLDTFRHSPVRLFCHQEFQVPKMEVLNLIKLFWGWVSRDISRIHTAYNRWRFLQCRYRQTCLVILSKHWGSSIQDWQRNQVPWMENSCGLMTRISVE